MVRSVPRARAGLSRLAASPVPAATAGADQRLRLIDEQDDRLGGGLHFLDHLLQPVLEFTLHAGAGLQQADVQCVQADIAQRWGHIAGDDAQAKPSTTAVLPTPASPVEDRVVLPPPHQHIDDLADFLVAADDGIDLAFACPVR